ncbi:hypothetical protein F2P44_22205 [Massilia sp. CCM 8695]|uniref:Uncharacterized protein n=1 Tax=Massilia frigida TaxID=2609281 RepID=A0ABX0NGM6_9BURK|nr:hypothetical protein [Massilia frigida]
MNETAHAGGPGSGHGDRHGRWGDGRRGDHGRRDDRRNDHRRRDDRWDDHGRRDDRWRDHWRCGNRRCGDRDGNDRHSDWNALLRHGLHGHGGNRRRRWNGHERRRNDSGGHRHDRRRRRDEDSRRCRNGPRFADHGVANRGAIGHRYGVRRGRRGFRWAGCRRGIVYDRRRHGRYCRGRRGRRDHRCQIDRDGRARGRGSSASCQNEGQRQGGQGGAMNDGGHYELRQDNGDEWIDGSARSRVRSRCVSMP